MGGSATKVDWKETEVTISNKTGSWKINASGEVVTKDKEYNLDREKGGFRLASRPAGRLKHVFLIMLLPDGQKLEMELGIVDKEKEKDKNKFNDWLKLVRDLNRLVKGRSGTESQLVEN